MLLSWVNYKFLLEDNNDKELEIYADPKVNSIKEEKQEMSILCNSQKVNTREKKYLTFKTQKSWKFIFTTCINARNKPQSLNCYNGKVFKNSIKK